MHCIYPAPRRRPPYPTRFHLNRTAGARSGGTALCGGKAVGQSVAPAAQTQLTTDELSKEAENPVSLLITLPLRYEADFFDGPYNATKDTFDLDQAIIPFRLNDDWALITRTKFPAYSQPPKKLGDSWASGLGNGYTTFFLSPVRGESFYWGAGPVLYYPSATNSALGVNKWGSGPSVAFVRKNNEGPWVFGTVVNNIWSFGGPPQSSDRTNSLLVNPFISYHFGDGWSIGSSPNITANWLSKPGQVWTVPVGGGIGKTFRLGGQAVKLDVDSYPGHFSVENLGQFSAEINRITITRIEKGIVRICSDEPVELYEQCCRLSACAD